MIRSLHLPGWLHVPECSGNCPDAVMRATVNIEQSGAVILKDRHRALSSRNSIMRFLLGRIQVVLVY